jgi:hypothetical protein
MALAEVKVIDKRNDREYTKKQLNDCLIVKEAARNGKKTSRQFGLRAAMRL